MVARRIQGEPDRSDLLPSEVTRYWKCELCRTSRKKLPVASASFSGSAAARWAEKARGLACAGESEGRGHRPRTPSGANKVELKPCLGPPRGSWAAQAAGRKAFQRQHSAPALTESHMAEGAPAPCLASSCASSSAFSSSCTSVSSPSTAQMRREAVLLRVWAKEAANAACARGTSAVAKKRIWVKSRDPSWH